MSQTGRLTARRAIAAADARAARTAGGFHMGTTLDRDVKALSGTVTTVTIAAADTCAARAAGGVHGGVCTGDGDVSGISIRSIVGLTAADARAVLAASSSDGAAGDGDVVGVASGLGRATDARAARAAGGGQAAGLAGLVLKGQGVVLIGDIV